MFVDVRIKPNVLCRGKSEQAANADPTVDLINYPETFFFKPHFNTLAE